MECLEDRRLLAADYGDAPDLGVGVGVGNYQTLLGDSGPSHTLPDTGAPALFLGTTVDADLGTLRNIRANADDVDGSLPDDEDGVLDPLDLRATIGAAPVITVSATNSSGEQALLAGWIDYNQNGVFEPEERATTTVNTGSIDERFLLDFPTIAPGLAGQTYARLRISSDAAFIANPTPIGAASNGEVEDYQFAITARSNGLVSSSVKLASGLNGVPAIPTDNLYHAPANLGDFDGDGIDDLVVTSRGLSGQNQPGSVYIHRMNADGTVRETTSFSISSPNFGTDVDAIGDVNGDGVTDLVVGSNVADGGNGAVFVVFLNSDGSMQSNVKIGTNLNGGPPLTDDNIFGGSVSGIGDLDGDGTPDVSVGAYLRGGTGAVFVLHLNADGTVREYNEIRNGLNGLPSETLSSGDAFGYRVEGIGDLDGDGVGDMAVQSPGGDSGRGKIHLLLMNRDGTVKDVKNLTSGINGVPVINVGDSFGRGIAAIDDIDGNGIDDIFVGVRGDDTGGADRGAAYLLFLNADGIVADYRKIAGDLNGGPPLTDGDAFGDRIASIGDLNGDGISEIAVMAGGDDTGNPNQGALHVLFLDEANPKPTLDAIDDLTIVDDSSSKIIDLAGISAGANESQPLRITAVSDQPSVIPDPVVQYVNGEETGGLTISPVEGMWGSATITVTVEDGGLDGNLSTGVDNAVTQRSFNVTYGDTWIYWLEGETVKRSLPNGSRKTDILSAANTGWRITNFDIDPISNRLFYAEMREASNTIIGSVDLNGNDRTIINNSDAGWINYSLAVDGRNEAIYLHSHDIPPLSSVGPFFEGRIQKIDYSGELTLLPPGVIYAHDMEVDAENNRLYYTHDYSPEGLYQSDLNGNNTQRIFSDGGDAKNLAKHPDSDKLFYSVFNGSNASAVFVVNITDGSKTLAFNQDGVIEDLEFGPDGFLYWSRNQTGVRELFRSDITSFDPGKIIDGVDYILDVSVVVQPRDASVWFNEISDVDLLEDADAAALAVTGVIFGGGESQTTRMTAVSSNPAVIPNPVVSYESSSATGSLTLTPSPNQSGTSTITVSVESGGLDNDIATAADNATFSRTFDVTVNPVNDPPTIDEVLDQLVSEDSGTHVVDLAGITHGLDGTQGLGEVFAVSSTFETSSASQTAFSVSEDDLVNSGAISVGSIQSVGYSPAEDMYAPITALFDGLDGGNTPQNLDGGVLDIDGTYSVSVNLNLDNSPSGYDIQSVVTTAAHQDNRKGQAYTLFVSLVGSEDFIEIGKYIGDFDNGSAGSSQLTLEAIDGEFIATRVDAIRWDIEPPTNGNATVYREFDAFGQASKAIQQPLRVSASSGDISLIPEPSVTYTSAHETGSLSFTPIADAFGTTTITVTVEDGGLDLDLATTTDNATFTRTFDVTVNPVNDAPTLDGVANLAIDEDGVIHGNGTNLSLFASDIDSDESKLEFRIENLAEIDPQFGLSIGMDPQSDSFAVRGDSSIHVHPAANFFGSTQVVVEARDPQGDVSNQQAFNLVIKAVNDPPVLEPASDLSLTGVVEDSGAPNGQVGTLVSTLIDENDPLSNYSDIDGIAPGIAIVGKNIAIEKIWFSTDEGRNWQEVGSVSTAEALVLEADVSTRLYLQTVEDVSGDLADALTIKAWDQTGGYSNGQVGVHSTSNAFSSQTDVVSLSVESSPSSAADDFYSPEFDGVETFVISKADLLANDTLGNGESIDTVTITADATSAAGGTITVDGDEFTYTRPASWFSGIDTFSYTLDDGGSTSNATVTILSGLQEDTLTITLEPGRDHDVTLQYDDEKLVLMDHVTQETLLNIPKALVPANINVIGAPANSNIVSFSELSDSEPTESTNSWSYQGGSANDELTVLGTGSQWAWLASDPQVENDVTVELKLLTTLIDSYMMIAVEKVSVGQVDRVEISDPYLQVKDSLFDLSANQPFNLPNSTVINGGQIISDTLVGLHTAESMNGSGQIDAVFAGGVGSLIRATGDLIIGSTSDSDGFRTDGRIEVDANTVTLRDSNQAELGSLTTLGTSQPGTLHSDYGFILEFGDNLEGFGTIETLQGDSGGPLINNGNIIGNSSEQPITINAKVKGVGTFDHVVMNGEFTPGFSPGLWKSGTVAYTDLNRFVVELGGRLAGAEFDRVEHYLAKLGGTLDVQLIDGFKPALGDLFEVITSQQPFEGDFNEILLPLQDNGVRIRALLGQHGIALETVFDVADTLEVLKSQVDDYQIAAHDGSGLKVQGDRFRAIVTSKHQFVAEHPWHTEQLALEAGKLVQIATDGVNRLIIEGSDWRNFVEPSDVNNDQNVTPVDALTVISELVRRRHSDDLTSELNDAVILVTGEGHFYDHNGDGRCTPLDAIRVINDLARSLAQSNVSGEGEAVTADYLSGGSDAIWSRDMESYEELFESDFEETELIYSDAAPETSTLSELPEDLVYVTAGQESTEAVDTPLSDEAVDTLLSDLEDWWK